MRLNICRNCFDERGGFSFLINMEDFHCNCFCIDGQCQITITHKGFLIGEIILGLAVSRRNGLDTAAARARNEKWHLVIRITEFEIPGPALVVMRMRSKI